MRLVRFTADWCQPCKVFAPQFDAAAKVLGIETDVLDIEQPENQTLVRVLNIRGIPAVFFSDDGANLHRLQVTNAPELVKQVQDKIDEINSQE